MRLIFMAMGEAVAEFFEALADPHMPVVRYALIAGLLASVAFGVVGSYVVARRITYIAGAIAHLVLGGIGVAVYIEHHWEWRWLDPMHGAVASAVVAAIVIGFTSLYANQREDTVIGAMWAVGMAAGIIFLNLTPGYLQDPMNYLFGNILLISRTDLWWILALDVLVVGLGLLFYNKLLATCFDEEFARVRGINVRAYYMLLLVMTALTVVLLMKVVGLIMVIAMLILPAAVASQFARRMWQMMVIAVLFCMIFTSSGLAVSYNYDIPTGPTIIVQAGGIYGLMVVGAALFNRWGPRRQRKSIHG